MSYGISNFQCVICRAGWKDKGDKLVMKQFYEWRFRKKFGKNNVEILQEM